MYGDIETWIGVIQGHCKLHRLIGGL